MRARLQLARQWALAQLRRLRAWLPSAWRYVLATLAVAAAALPYAVGWLVGFLIFSCKFSRLAIIAGFDRAMRLNTVFSQTDKDEA